MMRGLTIACLCALVASADAAALCRAAFEPGLSGWKVSNNENRLILEVKDYEGERALVTGCNFRGPAKVEKLYRGPWRDVDWSSSWASGGDGMEADAEKLAKVAVR